MTTRVVTQPLEAEPRIPGQLLYDPPESSVLQMSRHTTQLTPISGDTFSPTGNKKITLKVPAQDYQDLRNSYGSAVVTFSTTGGGSVQGDRWIEKIFRRITIRSGDQSQTIEDIHEHPLLFEILSISRFGKEYSESAQGLYNGSLATDATTPIVPLMNGSAERFLIKFSMSGFLQSMDYLPLRWMAKLVNEGNAYSIELELANPQYVMTDDSDTPVGTYTVTEFRYMMDLVKIPEYDQVIERALASGQKLVIPFVTYRHHPMALASGRTKEIFTINEFAQSVKHCLVAFREQNQVYSYGSHGTEELRIPGRPFTAGVPLARGADGGLESYQFIIGNMRYPMQRVQMGLVGQEAESLVERAKVFRTNRRYKTGDFSLLEINSSSSPVKEFDQQWFIAQNFASQLSDGIFDAEVMSGVNTVEPNVPIQMELNLSVPAPVNYQVDFFVALDQQLEISSEGMRVHY